MAPVKETLTSLKQEKFHELSSHYLNFVVEVCNYAQSAPSQQEDTTKGTLFGAYNAVTGYFQNVRNFSSNENKLKSILNGTGYHRAQTAFNLCHNFATQGEAGLN